MREDGKLNLVCQQVILAQGCLGLGPVHKILSIKENRIHRIQHVTPTNNHSDNI
jgi:hypothetical protein